jgi:hypothetical protein
MPDHTFVRMRALPELTRLRLLPLARRDAPAGRTQRARAQRTTDRSFDPSAVRIRWRRRGRSLSVYFEDLELARPGR